MSQFPQGPGQWPGQQSQPWARPPGPGAGAQPGWQQAPRPQAWQGGPPTQWQQNAQWQQNGWRQPAPQYGGGPRPPQPPPRRTNTGIVVAVGVMVLAVVFTLFAWGQSRSNSGSDTSQTVTTTTTRPATPSVPPTTSEPPTSEPPTSPVTTTTTTPVATGTVGPGVLPERSWDQLPGPHSTNEFWVTMQQNALYEQDIPTMDCPAVPPSFGSGADFRSFATATLDCQYQGWSTAFAAIGKDLPMPKVTFIDGAVQSACGKAGENVSFYCGTWDGSSYSIYVHNSLIEQSNSWWRLRGYETLAHEFGHHVQMMAGVMWAASSVTQAGGMQNTERSRRIELQTSCWAARLLVATPSTQFTENDLNTFVEWSQRDQDEYHGSAASNQYWWQRGMYMTKVGGCNTFTVGPDRVS